MNKTEEIDLRLSTHEEICALRYEAIGARLKRLETDIQASTTVETLIEVLNAQNWGE